jgi:transcriptional regulator with XRE-family HTH domain
MADPQASALRRARMEANMSQRALSILAGCSRDAVSRAERGDDRVSLATWRRLAAALGCDDVSEIRP